MSIDVVDAAGRRVCLPVFPSRIISLVPSITETLFVLGLGERLVGVTRYCTEPSAGVAQKPKVGGQKDPDLKTIQSLRPDLIVANVEENRREDVDALAAMGIAVYTTYPRTVEQGVAMILDLGRVTRTEEEAGAIARSLEPLRRCIGESPPRPRDKDRCGSSAPSGAGRTCPSIEIRISMTCSGPAGGKIFSPARASVTLKSR